MRKIVFQGIEIDDPACYHLALKKVGSSVVLERFTPNNLVNRCDLNRIRVTYGIGDYVVDLVDVYTSKVLATKKLSVSEEVQELPLSPYRTKIAEARKVITKHNEQCEAEFKLDPDIIIGQIQVIGGTTDKALMKCTWEELEKCGFPRIMAREVAEIFRRKMSSKAQVPEHFEAAALTLDSKFGLLLKLLGCMEGTLKQGKWSIANSCSCGKGSLDEYHESCWLELRGEQGNKRTMKLEEGWVSDQMQMKETR